MELWSLADTTYPDISQSEKDGQKAGGGGCMKVVRIEAGKAQRGVGLLCVECDNVSQHESTRLNMT